MSIKKSNYNKPTFFMKDKGESFLRDMNEKIITKEQWDVLKDEIDKGYSEICDDCIQKENDNIEIEQSLYAMNELKNKDHKTDSSGFIYFIKSKDGYMKIGKTINLMSRLKSLQTSSAVKLILHGSVRVDDIHSTEKLIHRRLKERRVRGEWFSLSDNDINRVCKKFDLKLVLHEKP